ncbi:MAG TPA: hypothetical protein DEQ98_07355 [Acidobacteria bacterium]|nr:hypothetical protein [Acidobacteriota bacterium]|tara:strand:- start:51 stop:248 length:198 start_codon:yes stop_codon:yes gene_type:complete
MPLFLPEERPIAEAFLLYQRYAEDLPQAHVAADPDQERVAIFRRFARTNGMPGPNLDGLRSSASS